MIKIFQTCGKRINSVIYCSLLLQLVKLGLRGDEEGHWADLTASAVAIQPAPSAYLLTLGGNGIGEIDMNNHERLATVLATMRVGLTRLVTTLLW